MNIGQIVTVIFGGAFTVLIFYIIWSHKEVTNNLTKDSTDLFSTFTKAVTQ